MTQPTALFVGVEHPAVAELIAVALPKAVRVVARRRGRAQQVRHRSEPEVVPGAGTVVVQLSAKRQAEEQREVCRVLSRVLHAQRKG